MTRLQQMRMAKRASGLGSLTQTGQLVVGVVAIVLGIALIVLVPLALFA